MANHLISSRYHSLSLIFTFMSISSSLRLNLFVLIGLTFQSYMLAQESSVVHAEYTLDDLETLQIEDFTFQYEEVNTLLEESLISSTGWQLDGVLPSSLVSISIPNVDNEVEAIQYLGHAYGDEVSLRLFVQNSDSSFTIPLAMMGGDSDTYSTETNFDFSENQLHRIHIDKSLLVDDFNMTFYQYDTIKSIYSYDNQFNLRLVDEVKSTYAPDPITTSPLKFNLPCSSRDSIFAVSVWRKLAFECSGQRPISSISNEHLSRELMPISDGCAKSLLDPNLTCSIEPVKFWISGGRLQDEMDISELLWYTASDTVYQSYFEPESYHEFSMSEIPVLTDPSIGLFEQSEYIDGFHFILTDWNEARERNEYRMLTIRNDSLLLLPFPKSQSTEEAILNELISITQGMENQSPLMQTEYHGRVFEGRMDSLKLARIIHEAVKEEMLFADSSLSMSSLLSIGRSESIYPTTRIRQIENGIVVEICFDYPMGDICCTCYNSLIQYNSSLQPLTTTSSSKVDTLFQLSNEEVALIHDYTGSFNDPMSYFNVTLLNHDSKPQYDLQWDSADFPTGFNAEIEEGSIIKFTLPFQFERRSMSHSNGNSTLTISVFPSPSYNESTEIAPIKLELKIEGSGIQLENRSE
ncbi:MAG: hypothetical protein HWE24_00565 [Oceanospirillaceae bacterium]|nr:hypothetical protein [Oceanospirillaceae bacterium]